MASDALRREAIRSFRLAWRHHREGRTRHAIYHYRRSLELAPSAEAYTFLGWALSFQGDLEEAIRQCVRAVALDPDFSNPYNDIGAYLIELGRPQEALDWLDRSLQAQRAQSYCYPHFNRGKAFQLLGRISEALAAYRCALDADPSFLPAVLAVRDMEAMGSPDPR